MESLDWCLIQPKIELHAHLNGSVRDSTLLELARVLGERGVIDFTDVESVIPKADRFLVECFRLFDLIHVLTTDHATVTRITKEVIEDFASENIVYVELRTTPKKNAAIGMTKRSYMDAVINGLKSIDSVDVDYIPSGTGQQNSSTTLTGDCMSNGTMRKKIYVCLLLSIDRRETTAAAMETVQLASEMRDVGVVGIDLSSNPVIGEWTRFLPALKFSKEQGLAITLHCVEVQDRKEEVNTVDLYKSKHPMVLCTDDTGVFSTTLSREYSLAASAFGLGKKEMFELTRSATEFVFADDGVKISLREIFDAAAKNFML
ncbi:hypothetical protein MKX01_030152 [Papaver californicum]|nr:hypothetical protein MKX01_030152 [Papaver californicum]